MLNQDIGIKYYWTKLKHQFDSNIVSWNNLHKCILILSLTIALHILWIGWKVFLILTPETWQWLNLPLVRSQIIVNSCSTILVIGLILLCYFAQNNKWAVAVLPHFILNIFIVMLLIDGYLVGIYSPATIIAFICISGLGLILFDRKIVYIQLISALTIFSTLAYCTYFRLIPYAPLFSEKLQKSNLNENPFWLFSMIYFIAPIALVCLVLCEVLLTQWRNRESIIKDLSETDPLTNLYNRRFFNEQVADIQKMDYTIMLIDIDHFKKINDVFGHQVGDDALRNVAKLLAKQMRSEDIVARYGGEEFIIALPNTSLESAHIIAERCRLAIQDQIAGLSDQAEVHLSASFGIAASMDNTNINKIIQFADKALYRAKQLGRNQVQLYQPNSYP